MKLLRPVLAGLSRSRTPWVFVGLIALGLLTLPYAPWSDDARFYVPAAESQGRWLADLLRWDPAAWSRSGIERAFSVNAEHPPVGKLLMAAGWLLLHQTGLTDPVTACRVPVVLLWAGLLTSVFWVARREISRSAGWITLGLLAFTPRLLYHGHAETLDLPVTALGFMAAISLFWTLERPGLLSGILSVLLFALALGTKLNAPFILVGAAMYECLRCPVRQTEGGLRLPPVPVVLVAWTVVAPLLVWLLWPWMWFDTLPRLQRYLHFHLHHYGIHFYFAGRRYGELPAPVWAPGLMFLLTTPLPFVVLALGGMSRPLWHGLAQLPGIHRPDLAPGTALAKSRRERLGLFVLLQALVQLVAVSLPGVPKYGGIKLFLPMLPFVALLAGLGWLRAVAPLENLAPARRRVVLGLLGGLALAPGALGSVSYRGHWLSYYGAIAGGVQGATERGFERQYYDLAYPTLAEALNEAMPNGGSVAILPNPKEYVSYFARWKQQGALRQNIVSSPPTNADVLVLTHERRWPEYPELTARYRARPQGARLLYRHRAGGIAMFSIYRLR